MEDFFEEDKGRTAGNDFDVKQYLFKLLNNYGWIILCLILSFTVAKIYLRYTVPQFQLTGYILIGGGELESSTNSILSNAGITTPAAENNSSALSNEIFILKSHILIGQVVDSLKLNQNFTTLGNIRKQPVFQQELPVVVTTKRENPDLNSPGYQLILNNSSFLIKQETKTFQRKYGQFFILNGDTILITKKPKITIRDGEEYGFQLLGRLSTVKKYISRLTVVQAKNGGLGLLQVSVIDEVSGRAEKFIEVLIRKYNLSSQNFKNQAIHSALNFLGKRLSTVSIELDEQENQVRDFKANNRIYDVSATANQILTDLKSVDAQKAQNAYQEQLLDLVEQTVNSYSVTEEIIATASGLQDPVLSAQIVKYNEVVMQKQGILSISTVADPRLTTINDHLADLRSNILKNITNIRKQFKETDKYYLNQANTFSEKFEVLPEKEKVFIELTRKQNIKQSLYLFLLQKREETEIQLVSSDVVKSRTVDDILNDGIVSPSGKIVYSIAGLIGLLLPALVILVRMLLNQTIESKKEVENGTNVPILGELSFAPTNDPIAITAINRSAIAEQIRAMRTNLSYLGSNADNKVLIVTSSMSGEGKSFVSLNLANSIAIGNKKVAILELDLRKPMLSKKLGLTNKKGITNYLIDDQMLPAEIIQPLINYPNLHIVSSGPIPPNPGELIINNRMSELIAYLRENFDFIILDSPPVGLVADALGLGKFADLSLFIIRHKYSHKSSLRLLNGLHKDKKLPNLSLIINGVQYEKGGYGDAYGYGYGYGYGHGYYSDDIKHKKIDLLNKLKKIFKRS